MNKSGNMRWIWILLVMLSPACLEAQTNDTTAQRYELSLQQAVDYAMKNSVAVKNALLEVQIQQQTNREVTGSAYPQLSASGSLTYNAKLPVSLVPAEFFGGQPGTFEKLAFGVKWGATGGVSISQLLFDGQVFTGLRARKTLIDFQQKNVEVTELDIRTNVHKIYYQLVVGATQLELIDSNITRLEKLRYNTKVMFDNGFAEQLAIDRVDVQIANLQTEKANVLNQISNGYLGLKVLMGMPIRNELVLTDTLSDAQVREGALEAADFNYNQRPDYQYAELGVKLRDYDIQRYRLSKIPTLSVNGYYNKNAQRNEFDFFKGGGQNRDWFDISAFTLNLNIPIFNGFATNARIARAKLVQRQAVNNREALKINIDNEVQAARNNYSYAITNMDYQKKNMALAESVYEQTRRKFEEGLGEQIEITNAQTDLKAAQTNYINALYNAIIAKTDFLRATGRL